MMRMLGWAVFGLIAASNGAALADDGPAGVLEAKGLRKAGLVYILPAEADVAKAAGAVRSAQQKLGVVMGEQAEVEGQIEANKQMVVEFTQQRRILREQMNGANSTAERNQYVNQLNELGDRVNLLHSGHDEEEEARKQAGAATSERREDYLQKLMELGNLIEDVDATYAKLQADAEVKAAIDALNVGAKVNARVTLGPSKAYQASARALRKAQGSVHSETIPLSENRGTFLVNVVLNGKVTKAMIFDTGASMVSLPAELASRAGLNPTDADPTIRMQTADGRTHDAKLMKLQSVKVGKFTVNDVECIVVPPDLADAPPLLGGSFLKGFTYKLIPEAGKLTLSRVGEEEAPKVAKPAKGAKGAKGSAKKSAAARKGQAPKPAASATQTPPDDE